MTDVEIAHNRKLFVGDDAGKELFVFRSIHLVHRLSDENAGNHVKYAGIFKRFERLLVSFWRHILLARFQQQNFAAPVVEVREQTVPFADLRHVRVPYF